MASFQFFLYTCRIEQATWVQVTINYSGQSIYKMGQITTILDFKYANVYPVWSTWCHCVIPLMTVDMWGVSLLYISGKIFTVSILKTWYNIIYF